MRVQRFGTIVVVGGGCYGGYYVRQLRRARARRRASPGDALIVVDRDADVRRRGWPRRRPSLRRCALVDRADWREFFGDYLAAARRATGARATTRSCRRRSCRISWPSGSRERARAALAGPRRPDERPLDERRPIHGSALETDGTHYVSFAEWMCPINCIEPRICPHTRGPARWSLPDADARVRRRRARARRRRWSGRAYCTARIARTASGCSTRRGDRRGRRDSRAPAARARRRPHRHGVALPRRARASGRSGRCARGNESRFIAGFLQVTIDAVRRAAERAPISTRTDLATPINTTS